MKSKNLIDESIKLQLDAKALGLDWIEVDKIISKIHEETDEPVSYTHLRAHET